MFDLSPGLLLAVGSGWLVGLAVSVLLFRVGCILADVAEPDLFRSLLIALLFYAPATLLGWAAWRLLQSLEVRLAAESGLIVYPGLGVYLVLLWLLAAPLYSFFLTASFKKGLIVAGVELLLAVLVAVLLFALIMVVLAVVQIWQRGGNPASSGVVGGEWRVASVERRENTFSTLHSPPATRHPPLWSGDNDS